LPPRRRDFSRSATEAKSPSQARRTPGPLLIAWIVVFRKRMSVCETNPSRRSGETNPKRAGVGGPTQVGLDPRDPGIRGMPGGDTQCNICPLQRQNRPTPPDE
jgi:hypothetical protein